MKAIALPSGMRYILKTAGTGPTIKNGDLVVMKYAGQNLDGSEFDSGEYTYTVGRQEVIDGWDQIALVMKQGTALTVFIPSSLAYKASGRPPVIMPDAVLVFDMEVLSVKN
jgi:FKBP-type peptidyl-prolyl cis-trans isomerase